MTTPTHVAVNLTVFVALMQVPQLSPSYLDLGLVIGSNLIDLDHLLAKPIYDPQRNPFTIHPLHKNWKIVLIISIALAVFRPTMFLGIGLLTHFLLDYIDTKRMTRGKITS